MRIAIRALLALLLACACAAAVAPASAQAPKRANGVHYVYLIRHGMYDYDSTVTDDTRGNGLNALGHEQAKLAGQRFAALPVKMRSLVTSPYLRALQTADDMGAVMGMKPVADSLIHECTPRFEQRPEYRPIGTEAEALACESNFQAAYAKYFVPTPDADTYDVLVCHGNVIRWLFCKAMGMDVLNWRRLSVGNCSVTAFAIAPDGRVTLAAYSDTGHIPAGKQTWTGRGAGWLPPVQPRSMK